MFVDAPTGSRKIRFAHSSHYLDSRASGVVRIELSQDMVHLRAEGQVLEAAQREGNPEPNGCRCSMQGTWSHETLLLTFRKPKANTSASAAV